jgi:hypothetical protein
LALALAGALLLGQAGRTTLAQEAVKQIELTAKQIEAFIEAQKDLAALAKQMEGSKAEQPDLKAQAEVEGIARKHGFKDFAEYDDVGSNIFMIVPAIDPDTKKFVPPEEAIKKHIDSVKSDKDLTETERSKLLEEFSDSLKTVPAIQHKGNIALIERYFDKLVAVLE